MIWPLAPIVLYIILVVVMGDDAVMDREHGFMRKDYTQNLDWSIGLGQKIEIQ